jgi:hypothetical protein
MGVGILTITKNVEGQEWVNTWGIVKGTPVGALSNAELAAILATNPAGGFTAANTNPTDGAYVGADSIIAALLGFERELHYSAVSFSNLNISDGTTPGAPTGAFWSQAISFTGLRDAGAGAPIATVAPLNIACLVNRNSSQISVKAGRIYYRAILLDTQVKPGSKVGVTWTDASAQAALTTALANAESDAGLAAYYSTDSETAPDIGLAIPHYGTVDETEGVVISGNVISGLSMNKPVSRQLTRGRRRRTTP